MRVSRSLSCALTLALAGCAGVTDDAADEATGAGEGGAAGSAGAGGADAGAAPTDGRVAAEVAKEAPLAADAPIPGDAPPPPRDSAPVVGDAATSAGCGSAVPPPSGLQTIVVSGKTRQYVIRPPKPYDPNQRYPVVFAFHGFQQTGMQMDANSGPPNNFKAVFGATATMVYPTALPNQNGDNSWARDVNDDLDFFDAMLASLKSQLCVDPKMVLAVGHSNGAVFANVIGCRRGNVVRGFAPVEGGLGTTTGCTPPPAAFIVHGRLDQLVSIGTGIRARDYWLKVNGCTTQNPTPIDPAPCVRYQGCTPSPVVWCEHQETAYNGTGHGWPPWATAGMWKFFSGL